MRVPDLVHYFFNLIWLAVQVACDSLSVGKYQPSFASLVLNVFYSLLRFLTWTCFVNYFWYSHKEKSEHDSIVDWLTFVSSPRAWTVCRRSKSHVESDNTASYDKIWPLYIYFIRYNGLRKVICYFAVQQLEAFRQRCVFGKVLENWPLKKPLCLDSLLPSNFTVVEMNQPWKPRNHK